MTTDFERNKLIRVADVFKAGRRAAQLRRTERGTEFAYVPGYLDDGVAVATTLPLTSDPLYTPAGAVPPYFAGLLPEGRRLASLRRQVKTSVNDELSLLLAVGRDPIGDVQVLPEGETPSTTEPFIVVEKSFDERRFTDVMVEAGVIDPIAIPGVQDKVSAGVISVPVSSAGKRYILKIDPPEFPHLVENEYFFLRASKDCGIPTAPAQLVEDMDGRKGLLIERFDRISAPGGTTRALACEDACQLLNLWPGDKYNVTSERLSHAVSSVCSATMVAERDVFRQLCFAWITGNGDVHAKNISVLAGANGEWHVAPSYDLPSTVPYGDLTLALPMGDRTYGISRRVVLTFGQAIGLNEKAAARTLDAVLERTQDLSDRLLSGAIPFDEGTLTKMVKELRYRRRQLVGSTSTRT